MSRRTLRLSVEVTVSGGDDSDVLDVWIDLLDTTTSLSRSTLDPDE